MREILVLVMSSSYHRPSTGTTFHAGTRVVLAGSFMVIVLQVDTAFS